MNGLDHGIIARFEVLIATLLKSQVYWDVAVSCCVSSSQCFRELWCLCLQYRADFLLLNVKELLAQWHRITC